MKIGIATIFPWRIHREQGLILNHLLQAEGHEVFHLECGGSRNPCYNKLLKGEGNFFGCSKCQLGAINHLESRYKAKIKLLEQTSPAVGSINFNEKLVSSALSLTRLEHSKRNLSTVSDVIESLVPITSSSYAASKSWAEENNLDAVFVFNGRMDILRGCFDAVQDLGIKVFSFERTWFGDGIQCLFDENCLGLRKISYDLERWKDKALTNKQAHKAADLILNRMLRNPSNEWRNYGGVSSESILPINDIRLLVLPSSMGEVAGHKDWKMDWSNQIEGFEQVIKRLEVPAKNVVVRSHPVWSQNIGKYNARSTSHEYMEWCVDKGYNFIEPDSELDSLDLIKVADAALVSVSTAAIEAAILGVPTISICQSQYSKAGLTTNIFCKSDLGQLDKFKVAGELNKKERYELARKALRFVYYMAYRLPLLPTSLMLSDRNKYLWTGEHPEFIMTDMIKSGTVPLADLSDNSNDILPENQVIDGLISFNRAGIQNKNRIAMPVMDINKSIFFKAIRFFRSFFKIGDR